MYDSALRSSLIHRSVASAGCRLADTPSVN